MQNRPGNRRPPSLLAASCARRLGLLGLGARAARLPSSVGRRSPGRSAWGALSTLRAPSWGGQLSEHLFSFLNGLQLVEGGQISEHPGVQISERSFGGVCNTAVNLPLKIG